MPLAHYGTFRVRARAYSADRRDATLASLSSARLCSVVTESCETAAAAALTNHTATHVPYPQIVSDDTELTFS